MEIKADKIRAKGISKPHGAHLRAFRVRNNDQSIDP